MRARRGLLHPGLGLGHTPDISVGLGLRYRLRQHPTLQLGRHLSLRPSCFRRALERRCRRGGLTLTLILTLT